MLADANLDSAGKPDLIKGMRLIGHDLLAGFGGVGEGMSLQSAPDGRRIMWMAHEGPPKNFTGPASAKNPRPGPLRRPNSAPTPILVGKPLPSVMVYTPGPP